MDILNFVTESSFTSEKQVDQANMLLYYAYKETGELCFDKKRIRSLFSDAGKLQEINLSRIINALMKNEYIRISEVNRKKYELVPINLQRLSQKYEKLWLGLNYIDSNSELINEERYVGNRDAINKIIKQINCCYSHHCFDACCVMMRRLFEVLLILAYQNCGIDSEIKDSKGNYFMLDKIVKNAMSNTSLKLSRNKQNYDAFRNLGNLSAHNVYYVATIKEIEDVKLEYKAMMDELFQKADLFR